MCEIVFLKKGVNELRANLENERSSLRRLVCRERDLLKIEIDDLVKKTKLERQIEKLKVECEGRIG